MADQNLNNMTVTWNSGATTFEAIKLNVTDTASASASRLLLFQVGGSDKFKVGKDGTITGAANLSIAGNATITGNCTINGTLTAAGIVGTVTGPASSTDNAISRFNGTTGGVIQNSGVIIDDSNAVTGMTKLTVSPGGAAGPHITVDRASTQNAVFEAKTTSGSIFIGQGAANTFAVKNDNNPASSPWFSVTSTAATFSGTLTATGAITGAAITGTTGTFSGAVSMAGLTATTGAFSDAVSGTTGTFSSSISATSATLTGSIDLQNGIIGRTNATISLRPNGVGATTNQMTIDTNGDVIINGTLTVTG